MANHRRTSDQIDRLAFKKLEFGVDYPTADLLVLLNGSHSTITNMVKRGVMDKVRPGLYRLHSDSREVGVAHSNDNNRKGETTGFLRIPAGLPTVGAMLQVIGVMQGDAGLSLVLRDHNGKTLSAQVMGKVR